MSVKLTILLFFAILSGPAAAWDYPKMFDGKIRSFTMAQNQPPAPSSSPAKNFLTYGLYFLFGSSLIAILTVVFLTAISPIESATTAPPPPPTEMRPTLMRYMTEVEGSRMGEEMYEIRGVLPWDDDQKNLGYVYELGDVTRSIDLGRCLPPVKINTEWTQLGSSDDSYCGTNIQARCVPRSTDYCKPKN